MTALARIAALRLRDQRGMTLPELLVATVIALLVAAAGMVVLQVAIKGQPRISERASQIQQGRTLIETVSRELRQGQSISGATASSLEITTFVNSSSCGGPPASTAILCRITYSCQESSCVRTEHDDDGGGGTTQEVATGLAAPTIFSYCEQAGETACALSAATHPTYVGIELAYPAEDGSEAITLGDGVALRNHFVPEAT